MKRHLAECHTVEDDDRAGLIRLRGGLRPDDGEPVRVQDRAPSLERWSRRDTFRQSVALFVAEWGVKHARTIHIRLQQPCPLLIRALGGPTAAISLKTSERIARTDPFTAIKEAVGPWPYRFVAFACVSGSRAVCRRSGG